MLATVRGALSGYSSTLIGPRSVSKTAFRDMGCLVGVGCPADMRAEGRDSIGSRRMRLRHRSKVYYPAPSTLIVAPCPPSSGAPFPFPSRSEEHTSELQSLMRISYAVFCLKKQQQYTSTTTLTLHIN